MWISQTGVSAYNAAIVGLSKYIKRGKVMFTALVQEYEAMKAIYFLQKEANLLKWKYIRQETAAQNIKNHFKSSTENKKNRRTQDQTNAWTILLRPWNTISR